MKIGFDAKRAFFNRSGLGNYSRNIITALHNNFDQNQYFLFSPQKSQKLFNDQGFTTITPSGLWSCLPSLWRHNGIGKTVKELQLDVYHGLSNELPQDIKQVKTKKIVSIHDTIFMRFPHWYKWHDREIYKQKTAFSCKIADKIIAVSQQTKRDLVEFFAVNPNKIEVIYQPCNSLFSDKMSASFLQAIKQKYTLPDRFLLTVGNIEERKNMLSLIQAKEMYNIENPIVIVGKNSNYAQLLKKYVAEKNIADVLFLHDVKTEELPAFYHLCELFVYLSFFEGFGIPIIEAMTCQSPIVLSRSSCFEETAGQAALYVQPESVVDIGEKITQVMKDKTLKDRLIESSQEQIKQFEASLIAKKMMQLYQTC